jgi:hypothetical protein
LERNRSRSTEELNRMNAASVSRFNTGYKSPCLSPCLWASFHPQNPFFSGIRKVRKFYYIWYAIETRHAMHKVRG